MSDLAPAAQQRVESEAEDGNAGQAGQRPARQAQPGVGLGSPGGLECRCRRGSCVGGCLRSDSSCPRPPAARRRSPSRVDGISPGSRAIVLKLT